MLCLNSSIFDFKISLLSILSLNTSNTSPFSRFKSICFTLFMSLLLYASFSKLLSETAIFYDNSAIDVNVLDSSTNVGNLVAGTSVQNNIDNSINLHSNNLKNIT